MLLLSIGLVGTVAIAIPAWAGALPQWLPVGTLDRVLNDAADDLKKPHKFSLRDCGNTGGYFLCTYESARGIGIVAWSRQSVGQIEQVNIAMPACRANEDLDDISAILIHILHPRRPIAFSKPIIAMARYAAHTGSGEHWIDGVSYHLIDRGRLGWGLVVRRTPPSAEAPSKRHRLRTARQQHFYLPKADCKDSIPAMTGAGSQHDDIQKYQR